MGPQTAMIYRSQRNTKTLQSSLVPRMCPVPRDSSVLARYCPMAHETLATSCPLCQGRPDGPDLHG